MATYSIILTRDSMYLTKREYARWKDTQDDYAAYMASLTGFSVDGLLEYMEAEYPRSRGFPDWPVLIREFDAATAITTVRIDDDTDRSA